MMERTLKALALAGLFALSGAPEVQSQGATPENTVIRNIATVSFTDANNNSYSPVADTVDVTVGFVAGVDVSGAATASPLVGSTADTLLFSIQNIGNGTDSVNITTSFSPAIITVTGYRFNGTTHPTVVALNGALSAFGIPQDSTITVQVVYDVLAGTGGLSTTFNMQATSLRDGTVMDDHDTVISPVETVDVAVTPDGGQNLLLLPNSATVPNYTFTFVVKNTGNGPEDYNLLASNVNPAVITSIVSVNGQAGNSATVTALAAGDSLSIDVVYVVANVAAGSVDSLYLSGTSVSTPAIADSGFADLTVVKPAITVLKEAYRDNQTTLIAPTDSVVPGEFIQYRITVTNTGAAAADSVHVDDLLPSELTYNATSDPSAAGWVFAISGNDVDADLPGSLAPSGGSAFFWIRAQVK